jgi:hypothetical protein
MELKAQSSHKHESRRFDARSYDPQSSSSRGLRDFLSRESLRETQRTRPLNVCAQCHETIFLPEWSEYLDARRVRHLWECEACGYRFETLVCFAEPAAAD